jgi:hypothetical protein
LSEALKKSAARNASRLRALSLSACATTTKLQEIIDVGGIKELMLEEEEEQKGRNSQI